MNKPSAEGQGYLDRTLRFLETDNGQRIAICAFSIIATLVLMAFEGHLLAYVFGIPYIFFIPGFAVVRLFFWNGTTPETRFILSLGLSVMVVIFLGLILVLTPVGLDSGTTRISLIVFALGAVAVDAFFPRKVKGDKPVEAPKAPAAQAKADRVVAAMLVTALVISTISLGLVISAEYPSRTYFAMTDEYGKVVTNTTRHVNTTLVLRVEMKNGEDGPRNFTLVAHGVGLIGERDTQTYSRVLDEGELWIQTVSYLLNVTGNFRVDFDLYIGEGNAAPVFYGNLHLWFAVVAAQDG